MSLPSDIAHIPLSKGKTAIVDANNHKWLMERKWYCGTFTGKQYAFCRDEYTGSMLLMHRLIAIRTGIIEHKISHINNDTLDNRVENLVRTNYAPVIRAFSRLSHSESKPEEIVCVIKAAEPLSVHVQSYPDLTNREFDRLWVIGPKEVGRHSPKDLWLCACKCGNPTRFVLPGAYLLEHESWSCGCIGNNYPSLEQQGLVIRGQVVRV